jgi:hypothetical protein
MGGSWSPNLAADPACGNSARVLPRPLGTPVRYRTSRARGWQVRQAQGLQQRVGVRIIQVMAEER